MSEVKFACPVCGQHITTDSGAVGAQVDCPSCFRKIVVPTSSGQTKLLVSASQVAAPRPLPGEAALTPPRKRRSPVVDTVLSALGLLLIAAAAAGTAYWYQGRVKETMPAIRSAGSQVGARVWTLDPEKGLFPEGNVAGSFGGKDFRCDRASLRGSILTFRHGKKRPSDMSISIVLLQPPSASSTIKVKPGTPPPIPRIVTRWRDEQRQQQTERYSEGYLLNLSFEPASENKVRGRLYLALPNELHSYIAGNFDAEIIAPSPPAADADK